MNGATSNGLRLPVDSDERFALVDHIAKVNDRAKGVVEMVKRHHRVERATWVGRIWDGPCGPEAVVVIYVFLDQSAERIVAEEKQVDREIREALISYGFSVGGAYVDRGQTWVRSSPIRRAA